MVMTMAWTAGMQASMTQSYVKLDRAFYAAESGAQRVAWYAKNGRISEITSPLTGTIGGYAYTTSWQTLGSSTLIRITSRGSLGNVSSTCYLTVDPGVQVLPTFASGGDFDNKNIDIEGDVVTGGNYTNGGSGSLTGDLVYAGTAVNTGNVDGTIAKGVYPMLDMDTLLAYLQGFASQTFVGNQSNQTFNFNALSGTNKVIFVDGNVSNPTFSGKGTLLVKGDVTSVNSFGTATNPINIVAHGDITTNSNITIFGTLYASGSWNRGKMDLTGLVYVNGISPANTGSSKMYMTPPPWFDPRVSPIGAGSRFLNFAGVAP
jgi:hypothetical protein